MIHPQSKFSERNAKNNVKNITLNMVDSIERKILLEGNIYLKTKELNEK